MDLPTRKANRLKAYDYSTPNAYFITVCTHSRINLFWKKAQPIVDHPVEVILTDLGMQVQQAIQDIPLHYPSVTVDHAVIMPNHVHLLLQIHADVDGRPMAAPTISTMINQLKGAVSKRAGFPVWQKGFHDHVIRGEKEYKLIWDYIDNNPATWSEDVLYIAGKQ